MPIWITAIGIAGIGFAQGFVTLFMGRRMLPPVNPNPKLNPINITSLVASLGITGYIGLQSASQQPGSMIGPYGIGLAAGLLCNIYASWLAETRPYRYEEAVEERVSGGELMAPLPPRSTAVKSTAQQISASTKLALDKQRQKG